MQHRDFNRHWHAISSQEAIEHLQSDRRQGLSHQQVLERQHQYGANEIPITSKRTWITLLIAQFKSLLIAILLLAAVISYIAGHAIDVYIILTVIVVNVTIAFIQEMRAERAATSLKSMVVPMAKVIRAGERSVVKARDLVSGDIVLLEEGDGVPADIRLMEAKNLRTIEASLTGESLPISKTPKTVAPDTAMADRNNMLWKSSFVAGGFAKGIVTAIGQHTVLGSIAESMNEIKGGRTHFHKKINVLAKQMAIIAIISATLMLAIGYFLRGMDIEMLFFTSIAMLVSAIPESLPAIVSIVLAIGTQRMARRNVIIREFSAIETLGAVTTIITDKTGTLTQNTLTVQRFKPGMGVRYTTTGEGWSPNGEIIPANEGIPVENESFRMMMAIAGFANNAEIATKNGTFELIGDPTEGALLVLSQKSGLYARIKPQIKRIDDLPFDSAIKMRASLVDWGGKRYLFVIGAPEKVLALSTDRLHGEMPLPIGRDERNSITAEIEQWSAEAMRVIALAFKQVDHTVDSIKNLKIDELVYTGITGMIDPPRPEVREAVQNCHKASIRVIMATGDHAKTALAIAKATGIVHADEETALTEVDLLAMDEKEFDQAILTHHVFARLTPNMKLKIADRLQKKGELIAMTGDGVNDAPALKKADVGIAMGIMGTDVARDASNMVLADDKFSTIVNAVKEGRIVFNNTRQTTFYLLTTNFAEITTLLTAMVIALPTPLTAIQILWLNLVTDGVNDMALAAEKGHGDELETKPEKKNASILTKAILPFLFINAGIMTVLSLGVFYLFMGDGLEKARTMAFITMAFCQLWNVLNMRSIKKSLFSIGFFSNRYIILSLLVSILVQVVAVETPFFERILGFAFIEPLEYLSIIAVTSLVFVFGELYKYFKYYRATPNNPPAIAS